MANTFLNTARTVSATSNPVANIEQVTPNPQQPVTSNVNGTNGVESVQPQQNNNSINPITIPIQIQPQIAQTRQTSVNNNNSIQTIANQPKTNIKQNQAPVPQQYQGNTQNNNVVDFNQIYSSYQNAFGNNQNTNNVSNSGIKKSSIGTTIVTPTTANINTVQGQYQSAYADTVNGLISEMLSQMKNGFQYNPLEDGNLRVASEYAANSTLQSLAGSGVLNSSATAERVARIVSELIPQYEEKAHNRWVEYLGQLADTAQIVMNYDSQQFQYWKDAKDREFENKKLEFEKQQKALENAWKRVDELGYVDNNASAILGVKVGTLSGAAREAKEQREFELQKMREQLEIQRANDEALYRLRSQLDLEQNKQLAAYQSELNKNEAAYKSQLNKNENEYNYQLQQKYGSSTKSSTSLNTYKDIINNRFADYDEFTKKYTVSDNGSLYNYLVSEYSSGRMSSADLANLTAMYNVTQPTDNDIAKQERIKYLQSLEQ